MSQQDQQDQQAQMEALAESNSDLVGFIQDYQGQIAEKTFQLVQANGTARKLQAKLDDTERALREANRRIEELEAEKAESKPARSGSKAA